MSLRRILTALMVVALTTPVAWAGSLADMKVGDVIECTVLPGEGTLVTLNGEMKGTIEGDDFAPALLRVWLGSKPPAEELKNGLLGAG
jgi:hypothetical protein